MAFRFDIPLVYITFANIFINNSFNYIWKKEIWKQFVSMEDGSQRKANPNNFLSIKALLSSMIRVSKWPVSSTWRRSEEHTSELQSRQYLVCRLLLEKKKKI